VTQPDRPEEWKPVAPMDGCSFTGYEVSDLESVRSVDRTGRNGRHLTGKPVSTRPHEAGYILLDLRCDTPACKRPHTLTMHKVVLTTWDKPCPKGMEACHSHGPARNSWRRKDVRWDTKKANEADKPFPSVLPDPTFPCRNAPECPNLVPSASRRCIPCVEQVGREAADMLRAGTPLQEVAEHFGYTGGDWVYKLATMHGGYTATKAEARTQRPPLTGLRKLAARLLKVA
jgi:hypothetical protein